METSPLHRETRGVIVGLLRELRPFAHWPEGELVRLGDAGVVEAVDPGDRLDPGPGAAALVVLEGVACLRCSHTTAATVEPGSVIAGVTGGGAVVALTPMRVLAVPAHASAGLQPAVAQGGDPR